MNKLILFLCFIGFFMSMSSLTQAKDDRSPRQQALDFYEAGNLHYQKKEYSQAIKQYEAIAPLYYESWEVYYNLGNAHFRMGEYGRAMLNYEKATRIAPHQKDIRSNIKLCQTKLTDQTEQMPVFFLTNIWQKTVSLLSPSSWAFSLCFMTAIFFFCLLSFLIGSRYLTRQMAFWGATGTSALWLFLLLICITTHLYRYREEAIVMVSQTEIKSAPEKEGKTKYILHEGSKVRIIDYIEPYYKVKMSDGNQGWISTADIEKI